MSVLNFTKSGSSGGYANSFNTSGDPLPAVAVGDTIELNVTAGNADVINSVTDNLGNTYVLDNSTANSEVGERKSWLYRCTVTVAGTPTITVTYNGGMFPDSAWIAYGYSGWSASPLDKTSAANDGASYVQTHSAGTTATTTQADEVVILFGGSSGSASPAFVAGTGYGNGREQKGFDAYTYAFMSDKTVAATGAQSGNFTSTSFVRGQAGIATYKIAAAPAGGQPLIKRHAAIPFLGGSLRQSNF